jgi:polyhydroxybutyrate depolymerase
MRTLFSLLVVVACSSSPGPDTDQIEADPRADDPDAWPSEVTGNDSERPAMVMTPSDYTWDEYGLLPVVVLLHGFGANSSLQDLIFQLQFRTDEGFLLVLPEGTKNPDGLQFWNATEECCDFYGSGVDDAGYLLSLLDEVEEHFPVDSERIVFTGHSNGGYMSHRLACEAADRIAGIASLAGATYQSASQCTPSEPISMLQMHGDLDASVLYEGTSNYPGAEAIADRYADYNSCGGSVDDPDRDYVDSLSGAETRVRRYEGCDGVTTELWTHVGSAHVPLFNDAWRADLLSWLLEQRL